MMLFSGEVIAREKNISGVVNIYKHVTSLSPTGDYLNVDNISGLSAGDTVLLIQMKGVVIQAAEGSAYGGYGERRGMPGKSEFLIISSINTSAKAVYFTNKFDSSSSTGYDVSGSVQLVRVPSYNSALVTGTLSCDPWNGSTGTGGVLALMVNRNLILNAGIDVTGKGFAGAALSEGAGICVNNNTALYDSSRYNVSNSNSGLKGESQASLASILPDLYPLSPAFLKGKGKNLTGGGGGNGRFSGGGGGSNYGTGGFGGRESSSCLPLLPVNGGLGGLNIYQIADLQNGLFAGGGGGASVYQPGATASPGAGGGGIIIILCDTLKGNGYSIKANGSSPASTAGGSAGAGGGGGGGSVALWLNDYSSAALSLSAGGGQGGSTSNDYGQGGGGGGGLIISGKLYPSNVVTSVKGGAPGSSTGSVVSGTEGTDGIVKTGFAPVLSGFLYNFIYSSSTLNLVDSICSSSKPNRMLGTKPVYPTASCTFTWEKSYSKNFSSRVVLVSNHDSINYTPQASELSAANDTVWFRRKIKYNSLPWTDISEPVAFIIHKAITNNNIGQPDTICYGGDPLSLGQSGPSPVLPFPSRTTYAWNDSTALGHWSSTISTGAGYDPPAGLTSTTWYRRTIASGLCSNTSLPVRINVVAQITGNLIGQKDTTDICTGDAAPLFGGSKPPALKASDGSTGFSYQWEAKVNESLWGPAPNTRDTAGYNPGNITAPGLYSFRRRVFQDDYNVCSSLSNITVIRINALPSGLITSSTDTSVCSGSQLKLHVSLTGIAPWSIDMSNDVHLLTASAHGYIKVAIPEINMVSEQRNYYFTSLTDAKGCKAPAASMTGSRGVRVYGKPAITASPDLKEICGGKDTLEVKPQFGTVKWVLPAGTGTSPQYAEKIFVSVDPSSLKDNKSYTFNWEVSNWQCVYSGSDVRNFYYPVTATVAYDNAEISFDNIITLRASKPDAGTGEWKVVTGGSAGLEVKNDSTAVASNLSKGLNTFIWTVTNGVCNDSGEINVEYLEEFIPRAFSPNGDGINDEMGIVWPDPDIYQTQLSIMNGGGVLIYSSEGKNGKELKNWKGTDLKGNALPEGTYYYIIKIESKKSGKVFKRSGFVILKRN